MRLAPVTAAGLLLACAAGAQPGHALFVAPRDNKLAWAAGGVDLGASDRWLLVRDLAATGEDFVPVPMPVEGLLRAPGAKHAGAVAGLRFAATWREWRGKGPQAWELQCTVTADPPKDRAIIVRVSLPLSAVGWTWWDDAVEKRAVEAGGGHYATPLSWEWDGYRAGSTFPFCAVSGPKVGLSLAIPLAEPRIYRLGYDAGRRALEAEFDLGLTPETTKFPARADFRLIVYTHDPEWGFRDALARYYELFPEYAERRAKAGGTWVLGLEGTRMVCPWDFGMRFDEGGETHAGYDVAHDIIPFVYTEPWGRYRGFGDKPTPDKKPRYMGSAAILPPEELKQSVQKDLEPTRPGENEKAAGERREWAQAIVNSAIERKDGSWIWHHWTDEWSPGNWLSNVILNPDPKLPEPNRASVTWKYELDPAVDTAKRTGGELGGIYLDSVCEFIGFMYGNFRREQWKYADIPMVADYETKGPAQLHAFAGVEFARQVWERMRTRGKLVMGNTGGSFMRWFCPLLDMIGAGENRVCGMGSDRYYRHLRVYGYHKPMSWMDYGFVDPKTPWSDRERGMQRCLFYAVHPGTGGFPASASYEASRPLFRCYEPLIIWLDEAGWQPVTGATCADPKVLVERYGPGVGDLATPELANVTFLALRNPGKEKTRAAVDLAASAVPRGDLVAWRLVGDQPVKIAVAKSRLRVGIDMAPDTTEVVAFGRREAVARLWLGEAQKWLARTGAEGNWVKAGAAAVLVNSDFEGGLDNWGIDTNLGRDGEIVVDEQRPLAGKRSIRATSRADKAFQSFMQGVDLAGGQEYVLRVRYRWQRPEGATGAFTPRFGVQGPDGNWVADKYIYFRDLVPTGEQVKTYEGRFTVPAGHSAKFFQFLFDGNWGTAWVDDVDVTSPALEEARKRMADLPIKAAGAAARLKAGLAAARSTADLLRLASAQRPAYEALASLAASLPKELARRRMVLPVEGFAEALGRGVEVLTGVPVGLGPEAGPLFGDAPAGAEARIPVTVGEEGKAPADLTVKAEGATVSGSEISVKMQATAPGGWQDVMIHAAFRVGADSVWLPRRATLRLHPPLEVGVVGPLSVARTGVKLRVRSWMPEATVRVRGWLTPPEGQGAGEMALAVAEVKAGGPGAVDVTLAIPADVKALLDKLAGAGEKMKLGWSADVGGRSEVKGETEVELVRGADCPALAAAPAIDGKVGAEEWAGAATLGGFSFAASGKAAARPTTVLAGHDGANLYLAFTCGGQPNPRARERWHDGAVWEDDAVEVFLQPPGAEEYYHFAVNAAGSQYEARCAAGGLDAGWNCAWQAKAGRVEGGWAVEITIPLQAVGGAASGVWRANFGREEGDTGTATCWSPTFDGFHVPGRFGDLALQ
jgi:hypothetical protein